MAVSAGTAGDAQIQSRTRWFVPAAFWLGLLAAGLVLWWSGQANDAWVQVSGARVLPMAGVVAVGVLLPIIHAWRWQLVMRASEHEIAGMLAADVTVSSSLVNYAGPGYLGAPAKAFLANRAAGAPYRNTLVSMAFEQGLDFLVLLAGSLVAVALLGPDELLNVDAWGGDNARLTLGVLVAVVAIATTLLVVGRGRVLSIVRRIVDAFRALGARVDRPRVALLTLAYWLAQLLVVALLLYALRLEWDATALLALSTLPLLAGQVVPLPGGIGAREAAVVALAGATGLDAADLLGLAVLQRVLLVAALPLALAAIRVAGTIGARR